MKARFTLALAVWCSSAFAQLPLPQAPRPVLPETGGRHRQEEPEATLQVEAVVMDANGRPVTGLTADDFEVVEGDKPQKISAASYIDGRRGRTLVFVIDDLELPPAALSATRAAVRGFVENRLRPEDRVAIVATSRGSGAHQQFSADPLFLQSSLSAIQPVGPAGARANLEGAARGALCQLRMVFENLWKEPGRKSVVFFSGGLRSADIGADGAPAAFTELLDAASVASVVLYDIDPSARSAPQLENGLPDVARGTGGLFFETEDAAGAIDRIAQDADGYYQLSYPRNESHYGNLDRNVRVRVKRPGLNIRAGSAARVDEVPYEDSDERLSREQAIPFSSGALSLRLTPLFQSGPQGSSIEALMHLDIRNVTVTEDLKGVRESRIQLAVATMGPNANPFDQASSTLTLKLSAQGYETAARNGISFSLLLPLRRTPPGGWQLWLVARDEATGRVGSASEFIEIPNLSSGIPVLSGVTLEGLSVKEPVAGEIAPSDTESAGVRIFRPGDTLRYRYSVYNLAADNDKRSRIEVRLRLYRGGEQVFSAQAMPLEFPPSDEPRRRSAAGTLKLGPTMPAGVYSFQLSVKDTLAPQGKPSTADRYSDFEVRR